MEAPRMKMGRQNLDVSQKHNQRRDCRPASWARGISRAKGYLFWLVTLCFAVLAIGLNRNTNLLKEGSTADSYVKLWFIIRFQNNKTTDSASKVPLLLHKLYVKCVQKQKYTKIHTELKANLLCLQAQPATFGHVICRMISGVIKTSQWDPLQQYLHILWKQDSSSWSLKMLLPLSTNSRAHD